MPSTRKYQFNHIGRQNNGTLPYQDYVLVVAYMPFSEMRK
jgi:hypothetical protein